MKDTASLSPALADSQGTGVSVIFAGDYVNKLSGQRIERECRHCLEEGSHALIINFKNTELVNSIGVSILLGIVDLAESRGARLIFSNLNRHHRKLFELLGLTRFVALADSEEAALTQFVPSATQAPQGY